MSQLCNMTLLLWDSNMIYYSRVNHTQLIISRHQRISQIQTLPIFQAISLSSEMSLKVSLIMSTTAPVWNVIAMILSLDHAACLVTWTCIINNHALNVVLVRCSGLDYSCIINLKTGSFISQDFHNNFCPPLLPGSCSVKRMHLISWLEIFFWTVHLCDKW